jgi:hypothetical protein
MFLGLWATTFSIAVLDKNPRIRVKKIDLSPKPDQDMPQRSGYASKIGV